MCGDTDVKMWKQGDSVVTPIGEIKTIILVNNDAGYVTIMENNRLKEYWFKDLREVPRQRPVKSYTGKFVNANGVVQFVENPAGHWSVMFREGDPQVSVSRIEYLD